MNQEVSKVSTKLKNPLYEPMEIDVGRTYQDERYAGQKVYEQVNRLLLWHGNLWVRIKDKGLEGRISDVFPDGFTVWVEDDGAYRIPADGLEVLRWEESDIYKEEMGCLQRQT